MNIKIMFNTLYKVYLEDFYKFCQIFTMHMVFAIGSYFIGVFFSYGINDVL
jgi:hypothetical protein